MDDGRWRLRSRGHSLLAPRSTLNEKALYARTHHAPRTTLHAPRSTLHAPRFTLN
jgi:hypothetical protein